jgi:O-antigen/teichoic acid export membrane protein
VTDKLTVRSRRHAAYVTLAGGYANVLLGTVGALILIPFYLVHIGNRVYGAWLGSGGILAWLAVLDLGLASLMIQRIADAHSRHNRARIGEYLSTGLALQVVVVAVMMAGAALLAPRFPSWMGIHGTEATQLSGAFVLAAAANSISIVNNGVVGFLRALQITVVPNVIATVATVAGLLATFVMLLAGFGVWSIPAGLVLSGLLQLGVNVPYSRTIYRREIREPLRPTRATVREFLVVSGPLMASKLGTAVMSRSDAALIAIFLRPELATSYALTRRAADLALRLLDRFGAAAFAGFAHLASEEHGQRAGAVHREIMHAYSAAGAVMIGAYLAINQPFVGLWVGNQYYLGDALTMLIGLSVFAGGASSLANYLLGATGRISLSAWINVLEALARFPLMLILLATVGVIGLPVAVLMTAVLAGAVSVRRTFNVLGLEQTNRSKEIRDILFKAAIVTAGAVAGALSDPTSWVGLVLLLTAFTTVSTSVLLASVPEFRAIVLPRRLRARFGRTVENAL